MAGLKSTAHTFPVLDVLILAPLVIRLLMRTLRAALLLSAAISGLSAAEEKPAPSGQTEKKVAAKSAAELKEAIEKAEKNVRMAYFVASQIRQRGKVNDADPEGPVIPTAADKDELETYIAAKRYYLKAQAELKKLKQQLADAPR
jgi:hypothetical protein